MNMFDKRFQRKVKGVWIVISVLIIISMTIMFAAPMWI